MKNKEDKIGKEGIKEEELNCPRCGVLMKKLVKNDVIIDVCKKCSGMWLDDKEIDKLLSIADEKKVRI